MFRDVALAWCDAGVRGLGGADESAAATRALRKDCSQALDRIYKINRILGKEYFIAQTVLI